MRKILALTVALAAGLATSTAAPCSDPDLDVLIRHTMTSF
jgi:hypothetical protein